MLRQGTHAQPQMHAHTLLKKVRQGLTKKGGQSDRKQFLRERLQRRELVQRKLLGKPQPTQAQQGLNQETFKQTEPGVLF